MASLPFLPWHRDIFPAGRPTSIVAPVPFHNQVRDGLVWFQHGECTRSVEEGYEGYPCAGVAHEPLALARGSNATACFLFFFPSGSLRIHAGNGHTDQTIPASSRICAHPATGARQHRWACGQTR